MIESFPYGKAPFWLTASALVSLLLVLGLRLGRAERRPDLVLALSAPNHVAAYRAVEEKFEREHGVEVALQLVHQRALTTRLQKLRRSDRSPAGGGLPRAAGGGTPQPVVKGGPRVCAATRRAPCHARLPG